MKKLINCFFKGIFATVMIAITGQLYWNFYIVEKFGIGLLAINEYRKGGFQAGLSVLIGGAILGWLFFDE